jgi:hypothetical protein
VAKCCSFWKVGVLFGGRGFLSRGVQAVLVWVHAGVHWDLGPAGLHCCEYIQTQRIAENGYLGVLR